MIEASCHCGAVHMHVETAPDTVTECNCSICSRTGGLWAYYKPSEVRVEGETDVYIWGDKSLRLHRCKICGNVTHWSPIDPALERMGVNTRLMPREIWTAARVRKFDGADTWEEITD